MTKAISGLQSGVDITAIQVAKKFNLETGGWMIRHFMTEDGPRPEYASLYGAQTVESNEYPVRTRLNVRDSDITIWFGGPSTRIEGITLEDSPGYWCTLKAAESIGRPFLRITGEPEHTPRAIADYLLYHGYNVVNFAGPRFSKAPELVPRVERFLTRMFTIMFREIDQCVK